MIGELTNCYPYIHHARNVDTHGLEKSAHPEMKLGAPEVWPVIDVGRPIQKQQVYIMRNVEADPFRATLVPVIDRNVIYNPPTEHLGAAITDQSVLGVARLTIAYLRAMTVEASQLP